MLVFDGDDVDDIEHECKMEEVQAQAWRVDPENDMYAPSHLVIHIHRLFYVV